MASVVWAQGTFAATNDLTATLQKGLFEEEANHDLNAAMEAYLAVIAQFDKDRQLAATALFRLGECQRKQGHTNEAKAQYERVIREFSDQTALVSLSRSYLAAPGTAKAPEITELAPPTSAEAEEVKRIQALIKDSPDLINAADAGGNTPLHKAAFQGQLTVARFLLSNGAATGAKTREGMTPLHYAASSGHKGMVELLLNYKADVAAVDNNGATPLHLAAEKGFRTVAEVLLSRGADANAKTPSGSMPLHLAVVNGFRVMAELLLAHDADVNAATANLSAGRQLWSGTALHIATARNDQALVEVLLASKADANSCDQAGQTPLYVAAGLGHTSLITVLLSHQADVNARNTNNAYRGWTPLVSAVAADQKEATHLLLTNRANPNVRFDVNLGPAAPGGSNAGRDYTALLLATQNGFAEMVDLLLASGADPNLKGEGGYAPIIAAANTPDSAKRLKMLGSLLDHGAEVDARTSDGRTPLMMVAQRWLDVESIKLLLAHKANVNAQDNLGRSTLHILGEMSRNQDTPPVTELLLAAGADPNLRDQNGQTPLNVALAAASAPSYSVGIPPPVGAAPIHVPWPTSGAQFTELLRQHGATEDLPDPTRIQARRPQWKYAATDFHKGTNDWNQFTVLELIGVEYDLLASRPEGEAGDGYGLRVWANHQKLPFPDLARLRIRQPTADLKSWSERTVDLSEVLKSGDCSKDTPLAWGEVVEIPEADHPLNARWSGFSDAELANLKKCLSRGIYVRVKGNATKLVLAPEIKLSLDGQPSASIRTKVPFWLKPALLRSNLLLASSDLARVKVTRVDPATGQQREWVFDCSDPKPAPDFWLRDGDVIEVPDKP